MVCKRRGHKILFNISNFRVPNTFITTDFKVLVFSVYFRVLLPWLIVEPLPSSGFLDSGSCILVGHLQGIADISALVLCARIFTFARTPGTFFVEISSVQMQ